MLHRRSVLAGLIATLAAPAIVRASSIMPVKVVHWIKEESCRGIKTWESFPWTVTIDYDQVHPTDIRYNTDPDHIFDWNQPGITVKSMYVPPSYNPAKDAPLDASFVEPDDLKLVQGEMTRLEREMIRIEQRVKSRRRFGLPPIKTLVELQRLNKASFKYISLEELRAGRAKPGVIT